MKNSKKTFIFSAALAGLFMILTLTAISARAAVSQLINFQGKLTDSANKAVSSAVPMVFKLYTAATGGTADVWHETQTVTPDESGIYSVLLGTVTPLNIDFSTTYWLGVAVGADAEMLPRYQLVPSAYSLYSVNSGTAAWAAGADWSGITNKPALGTGNVLLASTQIFTGQNTFASATFFSSSAYVTGGGLYSTGTVGGVAFSGAGTRFMWIPSLHAIRAGGVDGTQWDSANIGDYSVVFGHNNSATGVYGTISGGEGNTTNSPGSGHETIAGGDSNTTTKPWATISGGQLNFAGGSYAVIPGGMYNTAMGMMSLAAGYRSSSTADGTFTWADNAGGSGLAPDTVNDVANRTWFKNSGGFLTTASTNTADGGLFVSSNNYVGIGTIQPTSTLTVVGTFKLQDGTQGAGKVLTSAADGAASWATPAAGGDVVLAATQTFTGQNTFSNGLFFDTRIQSTGGGNSHQVGNSRGLSSVDLQTNRVIAIQVASGQNSVIGGGAENTASGPDSTISGGYENTASGVFSAVSGGENNTASGGNSTISGGLQNTASGPDSTVSGGYFNTAKGDYSFAAGYRSSSTVAGAFTWADSEGTEVDNTVADRTWFKNKGGFQTTASTNTADGGLFLTSANKVGIGTTNPGAALEVNGNLLLSQGADRTISVATTTTNVGGNNLTIAAGTAQQSGMTAYPGGNLYLTGGSAYSQGGGNNVGGTTYVYGGNGEGSGPSGNVVLADDGTNPKGTVGIGTITPKATLDINGFMRLARNSSQPLACDAAHDGAVALTNTTKWEICVCDGSGTPAWKFISDGNPCVW